MKWWLALAALTVACDTTDADCAGVMVEPFPAALNFGDVNPDVARRKTVLLHSTCGGTLQITGIRIEDDAHNGVEGDGAFSFEGPDVEEVGPGGAAGVRVTFRHTELGTPGETGLPNPDRATLVIETNAANLPTVVVPLCARLVPPDRTGEPFDCPPPSE